MFRLLLWIVMCGFLLTSQAYGQSYTYSYSSVSYDSVTDTITGISASEPDYLADEFYDARVIATLTDTGGNVLAQAAATATSDAGGISVSLAYTGAANNIGEYKLRTFHGLRMNIRDASTNQYVDYWNFGFNSNPIIEVEPSYNFPGLGPYLLRSISSISLGYTFARITLTRSCYIVAGEDAQGRCVYEPACAFGTSATCQLTEVHVVPIGTTCAQLFGKHFWCLDISYGGQCVKYASVCAGPYTLPQPCS